MVRKQFERLPTSVIPKHYTLNLTTVDLEEHVFEGDVTIKVFVNQTTKSIKLNALELVISEVIFQGDKQQVKTTDVNFNSDDETVDIFFESPLEVGEGKKLHNLILAAKGWINATLTRSTQDQLQRHFTRENERILSQ